MTTKAILLALLLLCGPAFAQDGAEIRGDPPRPDSYAAEVIEALRAEGFDAFRVRETILGRTLIRAVDLPDLPAAGEAPPRRIEIRLREIVLSEPKRAILRERERVGERRFAHPEGRPKPRWREDCRGFAPRVCGPKHVPEGGG